MFKRHKNQHKVAEQIKRLLNVRAQSRADGRDKRTAFNNLIDFERGQWNPRAFEDALKQAGESFVLDHGRIVEYTGDNVWKAVTALLTNFSGRIPKPKVNPTVDDIPTMTFREAAAYLGLKEPTFRLHAIRDHRLRGEIKGGGLLMFSKNELDRFKTGIMPTLKLGRPPKKRSTSGRPRKTSTNEEIC